MALPAENWKRPPGRPHIMCLNTIQRFESLQSHTERCSRRGSEPPSVEADVYIWCYALLVLHARKEEHLSRVIGREERL